MSIEHINYIRAVSDGLTVDNFDNWEDRISPHIHPLVREGILRGGQIGELIDAVRRAWNSLALNHSRDNLQAFKGAIGELYSHRLTSRTENVSHHAEEVVHEDDPVGNAALAAHAEIDFQLANHYQEFPRTAEALDRIRTSFSNASPEDFSEGMRAEFTELLSSTLEADPRFINEKAPLLLFWSTLQSFDSFEEFQEGDIPEILEFLRSRQLSKESFNALKNKNCIEFLNEMENWNSLKTSLTELSYEAYIRNIFTSYLRAHLPGYPAQQEPLVRRPWAAFQHLSQYHELYLRTFVETQPQLYDYCNLIWMMYQAGVYQEDEIRCDPHTETVIVAFKEKDSNTRIVVKLVGQSCSVSFYEGSAFIRAATVEDLGHLARGAQRRASCSYRIYKAVEKFIDAIRARFFTQ